MTINLTIPIECSKDFCCDETTTFCRFHLIHKPEYKSTCELFDVDLLNNVYGNSSRCIQCKDAEKAGAKEEKE